MELCEILTDFRRKEKISQREFARRSGLSNSLISILEMGVNPQTGKKPTPDIDTYKKIADAMGIKVHALFRMIGNSELIDITEDYEKNELSKEKQILFRLANDAKPEAIRAAVAVLEAMKQTNTDYGE